MSVRQALLARAVLREGRLAGSVVCRDYNTLKNPQVGKLCAIFPCGVAHGLRRLVPLRPKQST